MKAVGVSVFGGPEVLTLVDKPLPETGLSQVRIRVRAATVNPGDTLLRNGELMAVLASGPLQPPYVPGMEAAGVVDEIGLEAETDLRIGDSVMAIVMPIDATGGAYAQYLVVEPDQVARIPAGTSFAEAATLPMNGLTARLGLDILHLSPGQTVAVTGAAGAVGGYTVQLAEVDGLRVIADAAPADEELVAALGADQIVPRGADIGHRIRQWYPNGVDAVVDSALQGSDVTAAVRDGGQIATLRGWDAAGYKNADRGITLREVFVPDYTHAHAKLDELRQLVEEGRLTLRVARTYPAAEAAKAHRDLQAGGIRGRLVLTFD